MERNLYQAFSALAFAIKCFIACACLPLSVHKRYFEVNDERHDNETRKSLEINVSSCTEAYMKSFTLETLLIVAIESPL